MYFRQTDATKFQTLDTALAADVELDFGDRCPQFVDAVDCQSKDVAVVTAAKTAIAGQDQASERLGCLVAFQQRMLDFESRRRQSRTILVIRSV